MKVYLDDERPTPDGWVTARWPEEVISLLESGEVTHLSLDHDLGDDEHGTGYDVVLWVEEAVATRSFRAPDMVVHETVTGRMTDCFSPFSFVTYWTGAGFITSPRLL